LTYGLPDENLFRAITCNVIAVCGKSLSLVYKAAGHSHSELYPTMPRLCTTAPPKALDEDEVAFLEGVARYEKAKEQQKAEQEAQELAAFGASCFVCLPLFCDGLCGIVFYSDACRVQDTHPSFCHDSCTAPLAPV
jgi:hypothetical protein